MNIQSYDYFPKQEMIMPPNKYSELNKPAQQSTTQAFTAKDSFFGGSLIPSKEHVYPIQSFIAYNVDTVSDTLVRIYDGELAKRDEAFLVERKELTGKTPDALREHFGLAFTPRFLCDATIPIGHKVVLRKLTNKSGKRVSIYKAVTALELSHERPLTPENLLPIQPKNKSVI